MKVISVKETVLHLPNSVKISDRNSVAISKSDSEVLYADGGLKR